MILFINKIYDFLNYRTLYLIRKKKNENTIILISLLIVIVSLKYYIYILVNY